MVMMVLDLMGIWDMVMGYGYGLGDMEMHTEMDTENDDRNVIGNGNQKTTIQSCRGRVGCLYIDSDSLDRQANKLSTTNFITVILGILWGLLASI